MDFFSFIFFLIGVLIGGIAIFFFLKKQITKIQNEKNGLELNIRVLQEKEKNLQKEADELKKNLNETQELLNRLYNENGKLKGSNELLNKQIKEQQDIIIKLEEKVKTEFENIANKILKESAKELKDTSNESLKQILKPVETKFNEFKETFQKTHDETIKERTSLKEEMKRMKELNQKLSEEAENLTKALTQDTKQQGNWGEIILEKILEHSGLEKDQEYTVQYSDKNKEGKNIRPDVVVYLPEDKHIIIDSKVSLTAYHDFIQAENEQEQRAALRRHVSSFRNHIKTLSEKNYTSAHQLHPPDFILMFSPLEPAFSFALKEDPQLFEYAWDKKVVIVSPTTLLATLKTVASIWRHEKQIRHAEEIGRKAGALYEKIISFLQSMEEIKKHLNKALESHEKAIKQISTGKGNALKTAEDIRKLGAKTNKKIDEKYLNE
jgi:DNA recombination protein RmuC